MSKTERHAVMTIPGLRDMQMLKWYNLVHHFWDREGFDIIVTPVYWHDGEAFKPKLARLKDKAVELAKKYPRVSVIGTSAGASGGFNLIAELPNVIYKAVSSSGRLRSGNNSGPRGFDERTKTSVAFRESVLLFSQREKKLPKSILSRMMTLHPLFGDELVPPDTAVLPGAYNETLPVGEHMLANIMALTFMSGKIKRFLNK